MFLLVTAQHFYCGSLPSRDCLEGSNESLFVNENVAMLLKRVYFIKTFLHSLKIVVIHSSVFHFTFAVRVEPKPK